MKSNDLYPVKVAEINGELGIKLPNKLTKLLNWNEGDKIVVETTDKNGFKLYKKDLV